MPKLKFYLLKPSQFNCANCDPNKLHNIDEISSGTKWPTVTFIPTAKEII